MYDLTCTDCGAAFQAIRPDNLYCSAPCRGRAGRRRRGEQTDITAAGRDCGICGQRFSIPPPNSNQRYCSPACAREAARAQRRRFHERKPGAQKAYNARRPYRDVRLERLGRRYPNLPKACEACGETRVLEIAHRPGHERNGAWRLMSNSERHMIWILCPTCHKLLDKRICTPVELGLAGQSAEQVDGERLVHWPANSPTRVFTASTRASDRMLTEPLVIGGVQFSSGFGEATASQLPHRLGPGAFMGRALMAGLGDQLKVAIGLLAVMVGAERLKVVVGVAAAKFQTDDVIDLQAFGDLALRIGADVLMTGQDASAPGGRHVTARGGRHWIADEHLAHAACARSESLSGSTPIISARTPSTASLEAWKTSLPMAFMDWLLAV